MPSHVLIVDDDPSVRALARVLGGRACTQAASKAEAFALFNTLRPSIVLLDVALPDGSGLDLLDVMQGVCPHVRVIVITGAADVPLAVRAMRAGAFDLLVKPLAPPEVLAAVERAERAGPQLEDDAYAESAGIVGESPAIQAALDLIRRVAASPATTAILLGESGTGKELAARALHLLSTRADGPLVAVNCAAISENLLEAELFGYDRGAFTGARAEGKKGLFELAQGGTLLLDEIGETSLGFQAALLRVLEQRTVRRVGGVTERPIDLRVVAATRRDLIAEVRAGRFREDLFFRLWSVPITLPPLRERRGDVALLASYFLEQLTRGASRARPALSPEALAALEAHSWPGNVRELRNVVERALILCEDGHVQADHLSLGATAGLYREAPSGEIRVPSLRLQEVEGEIVRRALEAAGGNKRRAAEILGINRSTLYAKLEAHSIPPVPRAPANGSRAAKP
ncbi:MAG: sigma-54-dependent transcriptional regulator [Planctomycetota bacterium]